MRKKIIIIVSIIIVAAIIGVTAKLIDTSNKDSLYIAACEYIQAGDYENAYKCFDEIKNYKDTNELLEEVKYQLGKKSFEAGDIDTAWDYFNAVLKYKDSADYIKEITYLRLLDAIGNKELDKADKYALELTGYKDVEYQQQRILFERYMLALDVNDMTSAEAISNTISNESLKQRAARVLEYSKHGYTILEDLKERAASENAEINVKEIRCYQYSYNNNVEVPVYMFYTEYKDSAGNISNRYYAYMDSSYYGFCDTIIRSEIDMTNETQLYTFLKIEPYWDEDTTLILSIGLMEILASSN